MILPNARQGVSRIMRNVFVSLEKAIEECFADARRRFMALCLFRMIPHSLCNELSLFFFDAHMLFGFLYRPFDSKWSTSIMPSTKLRVLRVDVYGLN